MDSSEDLAALDSAFVTDVTNGYVEWHGVNGLVYEYDDGDSKSYYVPSKGKNGNWSYDDFADFYFTGNTIGQREVLIDVHIDKLTVTSNHDKNYSTITDYFRFAQLTPEEFAFCGNTTDATERGELSENRYQFFVDYTVTITWIDDGELVDLPFYQITIDLDTGSDYFNESWEAVGGFTDDFYIYSENFLKIEGTRFISPVIATSGNDSLTKAGVIALTSNGSFSGQFEEGNSGTRLEIFSQFSQVTDPIKSFSIQ